MTGFKGNKASLPSKTCLACGREMVWRKRWASSWDEVKYCSNACRTKKAGSEQAAKAGKVGRAPESK